MLLAGLAPATLAQEPTLQERWAPVLGNWEIEYEDAKVEGGIVRGRATILLYPENAPRAVRITGFLGEGSNHRRLAPTDPPMFEEGRLRVRDDFEGILMQLWLSEDGKTLAGRWRKKKGDVVPRYRAPVEDDGGRETWTRPRPEVERTTGLVGHETVPRLLRLPAPLDAAGLARRFQKYDFHEIPANLPLFYIDVFGQGTGIDGRTWGQYPVCPELAIVPFDKSLTVADYRMLEDRLRLVVYIGRRTLPGVKRFHLEDTTFECELVLPGIAVPEFGAPDTLEFRRASVDGAVIVDPVELLPGEPFVVRARFPKVPGHDVIDGAFYATCEPKLEVPLRDVRLQRTDDPRVFQSAPIALDPVAVNPGSFVVPRGHRLEVRLEMGAASVAVAHPPEVERVEYFAMTKSGWERVTALVGGVRTVAHVIYDRDVERHSMLVDVPVVGETLELQATRLAPGKRRFRTVEFFPARSDEGLGTPPDPRPEKDK